MIELFNDTTGEPLGPLAEKDLRVLVEALEEEFTGDRDYFLNAATIDLLAARGASEDLVVRLRTALGSSDGVDIRWTRTPAE